jgi:hypothetical protein
LDLPIDATNLFVVSRGSLSSGIVRVHQSSHVKDLKVSVSAHYHKKEVLSHAKVCLVDRKDGSKGVAILVSPSPMTSDNILIVSDPVPMAPPEAKG